MKHTISNRKGISSILGTLIFIGVIFSAVAPMFLMMRQADVYYEIRKHELEAEDLQKVQESIIVYGYSEVGGSNNLTVFVQNRGSESVQIMRVWTNDEAHVEEVSVSPGTTVELGPFTVTETGSAMRLKATTARGNSFPCNLGLLYWNDVNGWYTPSLGIAVTILNEWGQYEIIVEDGDSPKNEVGYYKSDGNEHDDIQKTFLVGDEYPTYYVTVKKKSGGSWPTLLGPQYAVNVPSASGDPIVTVVVDGR